MKDFSCLLSFLFFAMNLSSRTLARIRNIFVAHVSLFAIFSGVNLAHAAPNPFEDALRYTVQIKRTVRWPFQDESRGTARGAGFLVSRERGLIMTNAHVASRSPSVLSLNFFGGANLPAAKVFVDPYLDLAILHVDPQSIPAQAKEAQLSCSALPDVGASVVAMGHPGGFSFTATKGVISGHTARLGSEFVQTDAPINPGNSGGPLIDSATGLIVGINTSQIKGAQNTNFALASKYACTVLHLMLQQRDPSPFKNGWVFYKEQEEPRRVRLAETRPGTDSFGLLPDDIIFSAGASSAPPQNETQLIDDLRGQYPQASLTVMRHGAKVNLSGLLELEPPILNRTAVVISGALFAEVDPDFQDDVKSGPLSIQYVEDGSQAEIADLSKGDFLVALNGQPVTSLHDLSDRISKLASKGAPAVFKLKRVNAGSSGLFGYIERTLPLDQVFLVDNAHPFGLLSSANP